MKHQVRRTADPSVAEAIDAFEHGLGLSIRGFKKACAFAKKGRPCHPCRRVLTCHADASLHLDAVRTAFGTPCACPQDFVPPLDNNSDLSSDINKGKQNETRPSTKSSKPRPQSAAAKRSGRKPTIPVDFVYDVDVRKQLRAAIDAERRDVLHATQAREAKLREANQWLPNSRPKQEKVAWSTPRRKLPPSPRAPSVNVEGASTMTNAATTLGSKQDEVVWERPTPKKVRPQSAVNRRNPVADNVHFASWQTGSYHKDEDADLLHSRKSSRRRQHRCTYRQQG
ncbi:hypothetical protein B5M09_003918 [Aphanomyces astaci]|uniref:Uncharacterized protein n=1 Tax=Aphanomyces astaci TaxID=112090 RepID=A0A3R7YM80_APHAT|nr:hypothetical protein B5M09_003918 [Aphanomyces astaci]